MVAVLPKTFWGLDAMIGVSGQALLSAVLSLTQMEFE